jgi:hypothetical protein
MELVVAVFLAFAGINAVRADGITTPGGCGPNGTAACQGTTITATTALVGPYIESAAAFTPRLDLGVTTAGLMILSRPGIGGTYLTFGYDGANVAGIGMGSTSGLTWKNNASANAGTVDLAVTRYAAKQLMVSGDGTGTASGQTGWVFGNSSTTDSGIWSSTLTPSTSNYSLRFQVSGLNSGATTYLASGSTSSNAGGVTIQSGNVGGTVNFYNVAGRGPDIIAGTAQSAVSALSITQTWNYNAAAIDGVLWTFTDTSSHASTNAFRIMGGAAGTTQLFKVDRTGITTAPSLVATSTATSPVFRTRADGGTDYVFGSADDGNISRVSAGVLGIGTGSAGSFAGTLKLTTLQGGTTLTLNNASSGTLTFGSNAVTPASTGTRYLCISTAGVVTSSASACSGT